MKEFLMVARYQPNQKWQFRANVMTYVKGEDADGSNWGGNPNISYNEREMDYYNEIGQGVRTRVNSLGLDVAYQFHHNMFLDFRVANRISDSVNDALDRDDLFLNLGLRINLWNQNFYQF